MKPTAQQKAKNKTATRSVHVDAKSIEEKEYPSLHRSTNLIF
jgi:hypothetical protein